MSKGSLSSWDVNAARTRTESSAYNNNSLFVTAVDKLLMYRLNRSRRRVLPCVACEQALCLGKKIAFRSP